CFSADGQTLLSGSYDGLLKLWDALSGKEIRSFTGHSGVVSSVCFSADGQTLLSGSDDKTLKLWDAGSGKEIDCINLVWQVNEIAINKKHPNIFVTANANATLSTFDLSKLALKSLK
ncbi:MAG: WD40 repeat domain-containing protein, partial [Nitrospinae bacterium]|nr:WD40 repeat domain-containing protein [Nitrospinota bacterium]